MALLWPWSPAAPVLSPFAHASRFLAASCALRVNAVVCKALALMCVMPCSGGLLVRLCVVELWTHHLSLCLH